MIRSESPDDYTGYRGLFSSMQLRGFELPDEGPQRRGIREEISDLVIRGLREGEITPVDYMKYYVGEYRTWPESMARILQQAHWFNVKPDIDIPEASLWEFIPGANASIFGDPNVEGRYHIGFTPAPSERGWSSTAGFWVDPNQHTTPMRFRKHDEDFIAQPFIDYYETIAALPLFDIEQRPVMELQLAADGTMHFLQYYKTGHRREYVEPFDLPFKKSEDIKLEMVRGVTPPEGQDIKLFVAPKKFERGMLGQAVYCDLLSPGNLEVQLASKLAGFILHEAYISFQDNHFTSAPLFMPPLAAGFDWITKDTDMDLAHDARNKLKSASFAGYHDNKNVTYFNLHVVSNGHEIVLRSNWEPQTTTYDDLRG